MTCDFTVHILKHNSVLLFCYLVCIHGRLNALSDNIENLRADLTDMISFTSVVDWLRLSTKYTDFSHIADKFGCSDCGNIHIMYFTVSCVAYFRGSPKPWVIPQNIGYINKNKVLVLGDFLPHKYPKMGKYFFQTFQFVNCLK